MAKSKYTVYDAISLMQRHLKYDKLFFPYLGSCVLTGSFSVADKGHEIGHKVDDLYKIKVAQGIMQRFSDVFYFIKEDLTRDRLNRDGRKSPEGKTFVQDKLMELDQLVRGSTSNNVEELLERSEAMEDHAYLFDRRCDNDLYVVSLRFGIRMQEHFDIALMEVGQRTRQRITNAYNNPMLRLVQNPEKRQPKVLNEGLKTEHDFSLTSAQDVYSKYSI